MRRLESIERIEQIFTLSLSYSRDQNIELKHNVFLKTPLSVIQNEHDENINPLSVVHAHVLGRAPRTGKFIKNDLIFLKVEK